MLFFRFCVCGSLFPCLFIYHFLSRFSYPFWVKGLAVTTINRGHFFSSMILYFCFLDIPFLSCSCFAILVKVLQFTTIYFCVLFSYHSFIWLSYSIFELKCWHLPLYKYILKNSFVELNRSKCLNIFIHHCCDYSEKCPLHASFWLINTHITVKINMHLSDWLIPTLQWEINMRLYCILIFMGSWHQWLGKPTRFEIIGLAWLFIVMQLWFKFIERKMLLDPL